MSSRAEWKDAANAVEQYADRSGDPDRAEVLACLAQSLRVRAEALDPGTLPLHHAACRVLRADLESPATRAATLGDGAFVWGDAQGMEFAKLFLNRIVQAMLVEVGAFDRISPDVFRYALYPDAYLAANEPGPE